MANRWLELEKTLDTKRGSTARTLSLRSARTWTYARSNAVPAGAIERAKRLEGSIEHLYLDTKGYVTVGVGRMLPDADAAAKLAFLRNADDKAATEQEIKDEFAVVAGKPMGKAASYYKQFTTLHLAQTTIDALLTENLETVVNRLKGDFPDYDTYSEGVQEALIDMAFNLGNDGLVKKFPKFVGHIKKKAFKAAAKESHRRDVGKSRNDEIKTLLEDAAARP
jgi:GH24 family phage-related lysozyme (muramidase)